MKTLRLILGDQLNIGHSWFENPGKDIVYCIFEIQQETIYVKHHIQKVLAFFLSMRNFAEALSSAGHHVIYQDLNHNDFTVPLEDRIDKLINELDIEQFEYQEPDEWRLDQQLISYCKTLSIPAKAVSTEHFYTDRHELQEFFGEKTYVMEPFYRAMRKKHNVLMADGQPVTGQWNYDQNNRNKIPKEQLIPEPLLFSRDISELHQSIKDHGLKTIGEVQNERLHWPVQRKEALKLLDYFLENLLEKFGTYQDAMTTDSWSLFHSRLSFALNIKLISPREVVDAVANAFSRRQEITISQAEGFIRQILGWREYMRGIYWAKMPDFAQMNELDHQNPLPKFYWTADTKMNCIKHAVSQTMEHAYAHHIQRLMVTGNFALLAGTHPDEVDEWYMGVYVDAIQWVEITNTRGMSQFADGGIVGTKPYVSSGSYINKMSHYCKNCHYQVKEKTGDKACPFNSLYWAFLDRHEEQLSSNPRMSLMYSVWNKMIDKSKILAQAETYLNNIDDL